MIIDMKKAATAGYLLLEAMGVDAQKEPYKNTPERYARLLVELFGNKPQTIKTFEEDCSNGPITVKGHTVWTFCPHHMLPVQMVVDASYIPRKTEHGTVIVLGLSKLARICTEIIQEGPALQEKVTKRIAERVLPYADLVSVEISGWHLCCAMRGVKSTSTMETSITLNREDAIE